MHDVVRLGGAQPRVAEARERRHVLQQPFLGDERLGPGRHVHHAQPRGELDDGVERGVVAAREHVDVVPLRCEVLRDLRDVDVPAARIDAADDGQRRGVFTDHGDAHRWAPEVG